MKLNGGVERVWRSIHWILEQIQSQSKLFISLFNVATLQVMRPITLWGSVSPLSRHCNQTRMLITYFAHKAFWPQLQHFNTEPLTLRIQPFQIGPALLWLALHMATLRELCHCVVISKAEHWATKAGTVGETLDTSQSFLTSLFSPSPVRSVHPHSLYFISRCVFVKSIWHIEVHSKPIRVESVSVINSFSMETAKWARRKQAYERALCQLWYVCFVNPH